MKTNNELRKKFCGTNISQTKKILGFWWVLETQNINTITRIGSYTFSRKGKGKIRFTTEFNIIVDVEYLFY